MDEARIRRIVREELGRLQRLPHPLDIDTLFALKTGGFILFGSATLASGVVTVEDRRIKASSIAVVTYQAPGGTTGTNLKAACTDGTLTITAVNTSGSTVNTDTSSVSYLIIL